jgi:hypothetical protein
MDMVIGSGILEILIPDSRSLKDKRSVLNRILKRTQNTFNISIAEVGLQDLWGRARIGFSIVGNDRAYVNRKIDMVLNFIQEQQLAEVLQTMIEITSMSERMPPAVYEERKYAALQEGPEGGGPDPDGGVGDPPPSDP